MDLFSARTIFDPLYADIDGYMVSMKGREKMGDFKKNYTYGEIAPESFYRTVKQVKPQKGEVFYDLGSGTGKAVLLATLLFDFKKSIGLEIVPDLAQTAKGIVLRYEREFKEHLPSDKQDQTLEIHEADFLKYDFSDADVVFMHSTCFDEKVMEAIVKKVNELKKGSRVITVTKTLGSDMYKCIEAGEYNMGWGKATVYCYEKV